MANDAMQKIIINNSFGEDGQKILYVCFGIVQCALHDRVFWLRVSFGHFSRAMRW